MLLSGQQLEHVLPVTALLQVWKVLCMMRPAFPPCSPFLGFGTLGFLAPGIDPSAATPACLVVMSWLLLSTGFALCPLKRAAGCPKATFWVWSLPISFLWAFAFRGKTNSLAQKELSLKLGLDIWLGMTGRETAIFKLLHMQQESQTLTSTKRNSLKN